MTRASKLSRKRPPPSTESPEAVKNPLDESSDDFQEETAGTVTRRRAQPPPSKRALKENDPPPTSQTATDGVSSCNEEELVPCCPMCGKNFKAGQRMARAAHLKSCAVKNGVSTDKLLQIRQLEEKQAEERKALGLPAVPVKSEDASQRGNNNTTARNSSRSTKRVVTAGGEDPQLEMAIALSASLAHEKLECENDERIKLETLGILEPTASTSGTSLKVNNQSSLDVLLPQATTWIAPAAPSSRKTASKAIAKTSLQVRTEVDREKLVSERVSVILARAADSGVGDPSWKSDFLAETAIPNSVVRGEFLQSTISRAKLYWSTAGLKLDGDHYVSTVVLPFRDRGEALSGLQTSTKDADSGSSISGSNDEEKVLAADLLQFYQSKNHCDVTIHCKDGHLIECHYIMLLARCPDALQGVVDEEDALGSKKRILSWYNSSKGAVDLFLQFIYSAQLGDVQTQMDLKGLRQLASDFKLEGLKAALKKVNAFCLPSGDGEELLDASDDDDDDMGENDDLAGEARFGEAALMGATQKLDLLLNEFGDDEDEKEEEEHESKSSAEEKKAGAEAEGEKDEENGEEDNALEVIDLSTPDSQLKEEDVAAEKSNVFADSDEDLFGESDLAPPTKDSAVEKDNSVIAEDQDSLFSDELPSLNCTPNLPIEPNTLDSNSPAADDNGDDDVWANYYDNHPEDIPLQEVEEEAREVTFTALHSPAASARPDPIASTSTPVSRRPLPPSVTPRPNYESMLSPALRGELKRFGLKAIPRKKAVQILEHIYEETHPVVEQEELIGNATADNEPSSLSLSQESTSSSQCDDGTDMPEESMLADEESVPQSQVPEVRDVEASVKAFIKANSALHLQVMTYEPIWLEDFYAEWKAATNMKCKIAQVMDVLDNECVTFRTRARSQRTQKANVAAKRRKKSPKKAK